MGNVYIFCRKPSPFLCSIKISSKLLWIICLILSLLWLKCSIFCFLVVFAFCLALPAPGLHSSHFHSPLCWLQWHPLLTMLKERIEEFTGYTFNSLLCNLYRNEKDSVDWHSDDEPSLGKNPVIASLSFGATRTFEMRKKPSPVSVHTTPKESCSY